MLQITQEAAIKAWEQSMEQTMEYMQLKYGIQVQAITSKGRAVVVQWKATGEEMRTDEQVQEILKQQQEQRIEKLRSQLAQTFGEQ